MKGETGQLNEHWAKLIIKELIHQGVRYFCISPGSRSTPLTLAASEHPLAETMVHFDERSMSFHALGYAKASGSPTALIVTSGTAVGNLLPAIMEAHQDQVPLIILTADRPPELRDCGANQTTDQVKVFQNFVRHQTDFPCPDAKISTNFIGTSIAQAVSYACSNDKGPVHINCMFREPFFPTNTSTSTFQTPPSAQTTQFLGSQTLPTSEVKQLAEELAEYEKGVILVGAMDPWPTLEPVLTLSRLLQWPIFPDILSEPRSLGKFNGVIPGYDLILKSIGLNEDLSPNAIIQFGDRFVSKKLLEWFSLKKPKMHLHVAPHLSRRDPIHSLTHRAASDPFLFCDALTKQMNGKSPTSWFKFWTEMSSRTQQGVYHYLEEQKNLTEPGLFQTLSSCLPKNTALFFSNSMPIRDADCFFYPKDPIGPIFGNRGLSGIDGNIGTAIGLAKGAEKPLLAVLGDLSFLHDITSLAQLKSSQYPVSFLVINNDGGNIFSYLPIAKNKQAFEPYFLTPHGLDLKHAAPLFGLTYANPQSTEELQTVLKAEHPSLIEVKTERKENVKLHQDIITHLKEMQASASLTLNTV